MSLWPPSEPLCCLLPPPAYVNVCSLLNEKPRHFPAAIAYSDKKLCVDISAANVYGCSAVGQQCRYMFLASPQRSPECSLAFIIHFISARVI
ncbi:hypothetical protein ACRE_021140 [Hapsidospora chrysogenum ATCC 11550]|uniref:Uncharacterized protein n=1 Tax=Hapsidospora chrysogenum (strain ATCC 11550 / CBS 779.69 / DSM 880 / IAM 14645 / JCM 23072 / IMI 49137) TaxID=857340 RepID=A0A086TCA2_HAPC1|nr:hypothetical protein ACRE_021140 [Hapsidospora chrysogenum ATCC 11550]